MKALKILILFCFAVLFVVFAVLLQVDNTVNSTLFSDQYFSKVYDGNIQTKNIDQLVDDVTNEAYVFMPLSEKDKTALEQGKAAASLKKQADDFKTQLSGFIDKSWMETEVPKLLKGGYAYFTKGEDKLPSVNIKPLKDAVVQVYAKQIASNGTSGSADQFAQMIDQIDKSSGGLVVKGKVNGKAESSFMQMMQMASVNVSKTTADKILQRAATRKADGSDKQEVFQYAVTAIMQDKLGTGEMKDTLDLNLLLTNLYGDGLNPVAGLRDLIGGARNGLFLLLAIITLLLLAIIAVIAFSPRSILRWTGAALMIAGALCLIPPALSVVVGRVIHLQVAHALAQEAIDLSFLQGWAFSYINGVAVFMLVQSVVVIAVGVAFLVCSGFLGGPREGRRGGRHAGGGLVGVRVVAVIVLVAAIPLSAYFFGKGITKQVESYDSIMAQSQTQKGVNLSHALDKTLGTDLFEGTK